MHEAERADFGLLPPNSESQPRRCSTDADSIIVTLDEVDALSWADIELACASPLPSSDDDSASV